MILTPLEVWIAVRSLIPSMKDNFRLFQVEKIIAEKPVTLFLNDQEAVTRLTTPENLKGLVVGFMLAEGWLKEDKPVERVDLGPRERHAP